MVSRWRKLGLVFVPDGRADWMRTHAANPVAESLDGDVVRVYCGCRDQQNRASIASVDVELGEQSFQVVRVADEPVLSPGPLGGFDDSGTSVGCLIQDGERTFLYYLGWNLGVTVPWRNSIGLAVRERPGGPFLKFSPAPIVDRSAEDPYTLSYPCVLHEEGRWRMWYGSNLKWGSGERDMDHVIKYAESTDGIHWQRSGQPVFELRLPTEFAHCRPWVIKDKELYRMWFCHRGAAYRLGYAESVDGVSWQRRDEHAGLDVSADGWDFEMVGYPSIFTHQGRRYLFYNGNHYGKTGFGVAVEAEAS